MLTRQIPQKKLLRHSFYPMDQQHHQNQLLKKSIKPLLQNILKNLGTSCFKMKKVRHFTKWDLQNEDMA